MVIEPRHVYIAPGGFHLLVRLENGIPVLHLSEELPENGFRPSADVLFRSVAASLKSQAIGVIMTGMGSDGMRGLRAMKRQGAFIVAQDEASSVVWGMPRSAIEVGVVDHVAPLSEMAEVIAQRITIYKGR